MEPDLDTLTFGALADAAPDGILVTGEDGTIRYANAQAERMFGYSREALVGKPVHLLVPGGARAAHPAHVASFHAAPRLRPMASGLDLHAVRADGSEFPVEISLAPIMHDGGRLAVAVVRDVTERRQIERAARRANANMVSAVDAIQDAIALYDEHDRVVLANGACRQILGGSVAAPIVGRTLGEILPEALAAGMFDFSDESREALLARWLAYHRDPVGALEVRTGRGRYLRVISRKTPENGTVSLMMDLTDDVAREAELRSASAAKTEFLSSMSHELRTPLNAVLGFAQLLGRDRKQPLSERQQERLQHVLRGGEHLLRLIDDILDLSRIEAGRVMISSEPVAVADVFAEVVTTLEPMAARAQVRLGVGALEPGLPAVRADRTRLCQILMNFGSNAIKYGKPHGTATFEATRHAQVVRFTVTDNGIGIPEAQQHKLFEPFQRAGQETGPIEGTGIGLAISRRLAGLMEGRVGFASEPGRGSRFWVEIPVDRPADDEPRAHPRSNASASPLVRLATRYKVVYVEDNPSNIAFMRELFEDFASIELLTAPTAEIGLPLIRAHQPAVVIMDIHLPGMSGLEAVRQLQAWPETAAIPVIGLSAAALLKDAALAREAGFARYFTKPVKVANLAEALEELLLREQHQA